MGQGFTLFRLLPTVITSSFLASTPSSACFHFPVNYRDTVREGTQSILLYHDGLNAHAVVQTEVKTADDLRDMSGHRIRILGIDRDKYGRRTFTGSFRECLRLFGSQGETNAKHSCSQMKMAFEDEPEVSQSSAPTKSLPKKFAWVIPFPSLPSHFEELSDDFFEKMNSVTPPPPSLRFGPQKALSISFEVYTPITVGNYRIQPVKILADDSAEPFNKWLEANGFQSMPLKLQKPYLRKGEVFLAINAVLEGSDARLKPLHIVYEAKDLSYPVRFTHEDRTFDLIIYWLLNGTPTELPTFPLLKRTWPYDYNKEYLGAAWGWVDGISASFLKPVIGDRDKVFVVRYEGHDLNSSKETSLNHFVGDPRIKLPKFGNLEPDLHPQVQISMLSLKGGRGNLHEQQIRSVVQSNLDKLRICYEELVIRSPSASGDLEVHLTLDQNYWKAASVEFTHGSLGDSIFRDCVTGRIRFWDVPIRGSNFNDVSIKFDLKNMKGDLKRSVTR